MLLEFIADLSLATVIAQFVLLFNQMAIWFVAGLSAFDLSDLVVGMVIYLVERVVSGRGQAQPRRVLPRRSTQSNRIYPTLSPL